MKKFIRSQIDKEKKDFFETLLDSIYSTRSKEWSTSISKSLINVFATKVKSTKAYPLFLKENKIKPESIKIVADLKSVPSISKKNYLRRYEWSDLCKKGSLITGGLVMTSTSGSTGEPFYFPRTQSIDLQSSVCHELFIKNARISKGESVLVIDCFGMGVWIGGLITYQAFKYLGERGYPITVITPGINKQEIFQTLRNLASSFDHVILCGYPPFIKDIIDEAHDNRIKWEDYSLKIIFAAEGFSESFRDYVVKKTGIKNLYRDTMNIYGSADLGTMAQETPVSILLRRLAVDNEGLYKSIFGQATRLPTLAQYIPPFVTFESKDNTIYCTADNALPLFRYDIGDNGGVFSYDQMLDLCEDAGVDIKKEIAKAKIEDTLTELPFVYVYERSDFSATLYGALIYPEFIKKALSNSDVHEYLTGKFAMMTKNDENENQYLEINLELKQGKVATKKLHIMVLNIIHNSLSSQSGEYKKIFESLGDRSKPVLEFWKNGHETHFKSGAKQRWVKR